MNLQPSSIFQRASMSWPTAILTLAYLVLTPAHSISSPILFSFPSNPWSFFQNLTGCNPGDRSPLLPDLKSYLRRFGYLPSPVSDFSDLFDSDLIAALFTYQRNLGIPPTGFLDEETLSVLALPRCGVPDIARNSTNPTRGRKLYSYFPGTPAWPSDKRTLTYAIINTSPFIDKPTLQSVFARAFARWSAATTLNFTEISPDTDHPDITIGFYNKNHGDGEDFDGVLGTLAHAFSPTDGRFHLDAAENWVANGNIADVADENAVDLESVAVHEIGHLLGLGHSSTVEAVMYPSLKARTRKIELMGDDLEGIQRLYGENPTFSEESKGRSSPETSGVLRRRLAVLSPAIMTALALGLLVF